MAQSGLRILALDGGGTRGLSSLYILRSIMNHVIPDNGGATRPSEHFDFMAGSGLGGLYILLFARFVPMPIVQYHDLRIAADFVGQALTINEVIDFAESLTHDLDSVDKLLSRILSEPDVFHEWKDSFEVDDEPSEQLQDLRQSIVQNHWSTVIKSKFPDFIDRYPFLEDGNFNYKIPLAEVTPGRSRAFVIGSESLGYGKNGSVCPSRQYHVPLLHRAYRCRHGITRYTFYAVGLGTVASPDIMKPGVIFPDFLATGAHSVHNPVELLLEESRKLWPGYPIGSILSIGTGSFVTEDFELGRLTCINAEACMRIVKDNQRRDKEFQRFILSQDFRLKGAYQRFDPPEILPFFEKKNHRFILKKLEDWLSEAPIAVKCAKVAAALSVDAFPSSQDDQIFITGVAVLLKSSLRLSYATESTFLVDILSNYFLYEGVEREDGSFRKVAFASTAYRASKRLHQLHQADAGGKSAIPSFYLPFLEENSAMDDELPFPEAMMTPSDIALACYYVTVGLNQHDRIDGQSEQFQSLAKDLARQVGLPIEPRNQFVACLRDTLEMATLASLCEAGHMELLRGVKGLLYNGTFQRHLFRTLTRRRASHLDPVLSIPVAKAIANCISVGNWSVYKDKLIIRLLDQVSTVGFDWAFVNLAIERLYFNDTLSPGEDEKRVMNTCQAVLAAHIDDLRSRVNEGAIQSATQGYYGLLKYLLEGSILNIPTSVTDHLSSVESAHFVNSSTTENDETLLHLTVKGGSARILQLLLNHMPKSMINYKDHDGRTALHIACIHRVPMDIIMLLLVNGANPSIRCHLGRTPLHYCFPDQREFPMIHEPILNLVERYSLPMILPTHKPKIFHSHRLTDTDSRALYLRMVTSKLCGLMEDVTVQDNEGMTALAIAVTKNWTDLLDLFFPEDIESHISEQTRFNLLSLKDKRGRTALDHSRNSKSMANTSSKSEDFITAEMEKRGMIIPAESKTHSELGGRAIKFPGYSKSLDRQTEVDVMLEEAGIVKGKATQDQRLQQEGGSLFFPYYDRLDARTLSPLGNEPLSGSQNPSGSSPQAQKPPVISTDRHDTSHHGRQSLEGGHDHLKDLQAGSRQRYSPSVQEASSSYTLPPQMSPAAQQRYSPRPIMLNTKTFGSGAAVPQPYQAVHYRSISRDPSPGPATSGNQDSRHNQASLSPGATQQVLGESRNKLPSRRTFFQLFRKKS